MPELIDAVDARIADLESQLAALNRDTDVIRGALRECRYWQEQIHATLTEAERVARLAIRRSATSVDQLASERRRRRAALDDGIYVDEGARMTVNVKSDSDSDRGDDHEGEVVS